MNISIVRQYIINTASDLKVDEEDIMTQFNFKNQELDFYYWDKNEYDDPKYIKSISFDNC